MCFSFLLSVEHERPRRSDAGGGSSVHRTVKCSDADAAPLARVSP